MTTKQLNNLISYILIMKSDSIIDSIIDSNIDYIIEKYDMFFKNSPNKFDFSLLYNNLKIFPYYDKLIVNMKRWKLSTETEGFDKYIFTFILVNRCNNLYDINNIIDCYNKFFIDSNSLKDEQIIYGIHPIVKQYLESIILNNKILYRNILIKELKNKSKQNQQL